MKAIDADENEITEFTGNCEPLTKTTFNKDIIIDKLLQLTIK